MRFGPGDSMSSGYAMNRQERESGELSSFSFSKSCWTRGTQPAVACLSISGYVHSVAAKTAGSCPRLVEIPLASVAFQLGRTREVSIKFFYEVSYRSKRDRCFRASPKHATPANSTQKSTAKLSGAALMIDRKDKVCNGRAGSPWPLQHRRGRRLRAKHRISTGMSPSVQRSAEGRVFDCEFVAYPQLRSTFLRARRIKVKVPPTSTVNRYASQNIHLSFACWKPVVASPMSAQPESAHKQENAGQDPAGDAAPE